MVFVTQGGSLAASLDEQVLLVCSIGQEMETESHAPRLCAPQGWNLAARFEVTANVAIYVIGEIKLCSKLSAVFQVEH